MAIPTEVLFINEDYIKKYTTLTTAVDVNIITPAVYLAQDKSIQRFLGTELFNKLKSDISNNNLSGDYATLMDEYVLKATLWWTMVELYPSLLYKLDNGNLVSRQSEDTTPVTKYEMESLRDAARDNARYYTKRLVDYLRFNNNLFPEYSSNKNNDIFPDRNPYGKSNFLITNSRTETRNRWHLKDFLPPTY